MQYNSGSTDYKLQYKYNIGLTECSFEFDEENEAFQTQLPNTKDIS